MRALLLPLFALLVFSQPASAPRPDVPDESQRRQPTLFTDDQRAQCTARGGQVATAGLSGDDMCSEPLRDAGRSCRGSGDCIGFCELDASGLNGKRPEVGSSAPGRCQRMNYQYGCRETVEGGRFQGTLCID